MWASLTAIQRTKEGMKQRKCLEEQSATAFRQMDAGAPIPEVTRTLEISESTLAHVARQGGYPRQE